LKLAILNTMYGKGPRTSMSPCPHWCMYDPLHRLGTESIGFKWSNSGGCWNVLVGVTNPLCYKHSIVEAVWAAAKILNRCCSYPTVMPTNNPTKLPKVDQTYSPSFNPTSLPTICSTEDDCSQFVGLASWNEEYVNSLCINHGTTDKSANATLCAAYVGNVDYENSLKLAILNTMYGTGPVVNNCGYYCMYDPLNIVGPAAVGFKWSNSKSCWNVLVGASNRLCYEFSIKEWEWAISKTQNFCCPF